MNKERIIEIGKFLEKRLFIHRQVEHNDKWSTEEKMIQELYDSYLSIKEENTNLKQALIDIRELVNDLAYGNFFTEIHNFRDSQPGKDILQIIDKVLGDEK